MPSGNDPADLLMEGHADEFAAALNGAVDALEFRWQQFLQGFGTGQEGGPARKEATDAFLQFLAQTPTLHAGDALQRGMWAVRVGNLLGLDARETQQALRRFIRVSPEQHVPSEAAARPKTDAEQAAL